MTGDRQNFVGSPAPVAETVSDSVQAAPAGDGFLLVPHLTLTATTWAWPPRRRGGGGAGGVLQSPYGHGVVEDVASPQRVTSSTAPRVPVGWSDASAAAVMCWYCPQFHQHMTAVSDPQVE